MSKNTTIREASGKDLKTITRYTLQLHHHESDSQLAPHENFETNLGKWLSSELKNPNSLVLIAERKFSDNSCRPIGFISATSIINDNGFLQDPIKGVIQLLWVDEKYRQQQVANCLVKNIEQCFCRLGIKYVECNYTQGNSLAQSYWGKGGYQKTSVTARKFLS